MFFEDFIGSLYVFVVVVIVVIAAIVVATKRDKQQGLFAGVRPGDSNNPLYVPPQDVLSLVPESNKTQYRINKKEKEM